MPRGNPTLTELVATQPRIDLARPTGADVALEVAALRQVARPGVALELRARMARVEQGRDALRTRLLDLLRYADRAAAVHGEAFVFESLGQTERELLALSRTVGLEAGS